MVENPEEVNIKIIGYEKIIPTEEGLGNYQVEFRLSSQPPGPAWIDAFEDAYNNKSSLLQGNAKVEGNRIIVEEVNESTDPRLLLDTVVNEAVERANIEYNQQIEALEQQKKWNEEG